MAGSLTLVLLALSTRYGWHSDEFYYLQSGKHLAWGYVDNPPLVPFIARMTTEIAPHNLFVLRVFPALVAGATVVMGSIVVRALGGSRRAQVVGAGATASGGFVLGVGHVLATPGFDVFAWLSLIAIAAHIMRTGDTRWWVAFGGVAGVALLNKNLVVMLVVALAVGLVIERRWDVLRNTWLVVGALLALAIAAPHLVWQVQHDWPQLEFAQALEHRIGMLNRITLIPFQVLFVGPAFVVIGWRGVQWLRGAGSQFRALLWAWLIVLVLVFVTGGRPYYVVPLTTVLVLAGLIHYDDPAHVRGFLALAIPNLVIGALFALPILPASAAPFSASLNETVAQQFGWPELARQVRGVRDGLPPADRADAIVLTQAYGEAGALEFYREQDDLPPIYSPHNSYADFGQPTNNKSVVITLRYPSKELRKYFTECTVVARVTNTRKIANEIYDTPIHVCRGLRNPWSQTWDEMRFFS